MPFRFGDVERTAFERELRPILVKASRQLGSPTEARKGFCREDAIQQVMLEIHEFLSGLASLKRFRHRNLSVKTPDDLTEYALRRLRTVHDSNGRAALRERDWAINRQGDVLDAAAAPDPIEHPIYDRQFLEDLLFHLAKDDIGYRYVTLIINSHILGGTQDLDPCDNTLIAKILNCKPSDVRNARYRIQTLKNQLLAKRAAENPEDSDR